MISAKTKQKNGFSLLESSYLDLLTLMDRVWDHLSRLRESRAICMAMKIF